MIVIANAIGAFDESLEEACEECNGTGEKEIKKRVGEEGMRIEMDVPVVCMWCGGTGKVKIGDQ